jgi:hypothetical protein
MEQKSCCLQVFYGSSNKIIMERGGGGIIIRVNPVFLVVGNGAIIKFSLNVRNTVTMIII